MQQHDPNLERNFIRATVRQRARELRKEPTKAEEKLWQALRRRSLAGYKFRRQHPIGSYILDFYCPARRLGIEVDGSIHDRQRDADSYRDAVLNTQGVRVIRFKNEDVLYRLETVLDTIHAALHAALHDP